MNCRSSCGACCIAPSITSPIPGMPKGKAAGEPCINLNPDKSCRIHAKENYPAFCKGLRPSSEMCGKTTEEAFSFLNELERLTSP